MGIPKLQTNMSANRLRILLIGAPGSGKGTVGKMLEKEFGSSLVSTGDLLRAEISAQTDLGKQAAVHINKGGLVPNELVVGILENALVAQKDRNRGWLLDGYPRSLQQAEALDSMMEKHDFPFHLLINLVVSKQLIVERISGRLLHAPSGRIYHETFTPPKVPGMDDVTGEPLVRRSDDDPETVLKRLETYESQSKPVIQHYLDICPESVLEVECETSKEAFRAISPFTSELAANLGLNDKH